MLSSRKFMATLVAIMASLSVTGMVPAIETGHVPAGMTPVQFQENTAAGPQRGPSMNTPPSKSFCKDLFTSTCMITGTTDIAAHITGVKYFLPQLSTLRFANMGGIDPQVFGMQLEDLKSFHESKWCPYWNALAQKYEAEARDRLAAKGGNMDLAVEDALVKAITYYSVSAWPGTTPLRLQAYAKARDVFDRWAPVTDPDIQKVSLSIAGEEVTGYLHLPAGAGRYPTVIVTNGLEGTIPELAFPLLKYRNEKIGVFMMEMPGTYAYTQPMSVASEAVYNGVIDYLAANPRIDPARIAMVGVCFGGYWAARMAAVTPRLCCTVACGAPLRHAFTISNSFGLPAIMISTLEKVVGAHSLLDLHAKMEALSFAEGDLYHKINIPLLVINGDTDTLIGTRDSIELNSKVPTSFLKLYENDDHCAMGHYNQWLDLTFEWLKMQFAQSKGS